MRGLGLFVEIPFGQGSRLAFPRKCLFTEIPFRQGPRPHFLVHPFLSISRSIREPSSRMRDLGLFVEIPFGQGSRLAFPRKCLFTEIPFRQVPRPPFPRKPLFIDIPFRQGAEQSDVRSWSFRRNPLRSGGNRHPIWPSPFEIEDILDRGMKREVNESPSERVAMSKRRPFLTKRDFGKKGEKEVAAPIVGRTPPSRTFPTKRRGTGPERAGFRGYARFVHNGGHSLHRLRRIGSTDVVVVYIYEKTNNASNKTASPSGKRKPASSREVRRVRRAWRTACGHRPTMPGLPRTCG